MRSNKVYLYLYSRERSRNSHTLQIRYTFNIMTTGPSGITSNLAPNAHAIQRQTDLSGRSTGRRRAFRGCRASGQVAQDGLLQRRRQRCRERRHQWTQQLEGRRARRRHRGLQVGLRFQRADAPLQLDDVGMRCAPQHNRSWGDRGGQSTISLAKR